MLIILQLLCIAAYRKYGLHIKDFGKSWKDGVAFNAMIHNIRPDLVDMDAVKRQQARVNLEHAFSTAENQLGIPRLLDPEGEWKVVRIAFPLWNTIF